MRAYPMWWGLHKTNDTAMNIYLNAPEDKTNVNLTLIQRRRCSASPAAESELCES